MKKAKFLCLPYILGLLNTDGSFFVILKKDPSMKLGWRLNPTVQISLKEKFKELLQSIGTFLEKNYKIKSKVKNKGTLSSPKIKNKKRAWVLEIEGLQNVALFLKTIENSTLSSPLVGLI